MRYVDGDMIKHILKYIFTFLGMTFLLTGLLVMCAKIPRAAIRENVKESADMLCQGELFGCRIEGVNGSIIDRYADSILLGIAYSYDSSRPFVSVMESKYYHRYNYNENENLLKAVTEECEPNQQYLRYWHGSIALVRPLLQVFNLRQIYILNACILALLGIVLLVLLLRQKAYIPVFGIVLGLVMTSAWFVPYSLEYTWTYMLMLIFSILAVVLSNGKRDGLLGPLFMISGMLTSFMDFLTTETLTLTVPLLLVLWIIAGQRRPEETSLGKAAAGCGVWLLGYAGMWIMKWLLAAIAMSENVMPYVLEHIGERIGGDVGVGAVSSIVGAIGRNIGCLFPLEYGPWGIFAGFCLIMFALYKGFVYRRYDLDKKRIIAYVLIGMIPYVRYVIIHNHSYIHYFFTYRAQLGTIVAAVLLLEHLVKGKEKA